MRLSFAPISFLLFCFTLGGQVPLAPPTGSQPVTPDMVIAIVGDKQLTVAEFERLTAGLDENSRSLAAKNPKRFLEQITYAEALAAEAEKAGLDKRTPYREQLERSRRQILTQALMSHKTETAPVTADQVAKYFEEHKADYRQARAKIIFISRETHTFNLADGKRAGGASAEESDKKAKSAAERARAGEDFVKLAKEFSDDKESAAKGADFPFPIRPSTQGLPENMKQAVLAAKAGDVVGPISHNTGFYIFRVEAMEEPSLEASRADIEQLLRQNSVREFLRGVQKRADVSLTNEAFWKAFAALQAKQPGGEAK